MLSLMLTMALKRIVLHVISRRKMVRSLKKGETAEFKVIEFNKDNRRIVVSHVAH